MTTFNHYLSTRKHAALLSFVLATSTITANAAQSVDQLVQAVSSHVVKIQVSLNNGSYGMGSGVVVAQDQVVTNCHVVANAASVSVNTGTENFTASQLKADWHHDLCMLTVVGLNVPAAPISNSQALKYEQPVYTVGFANNSPRPNSTYGVIKGLYPMDDSVIVRASNPFRLGDSGGGLFNEAGELVGIITVKSPGRGAFYYHMPVEWVKALFDKPQQSIVSESALPFWAEAQEKWPFFMRVVQPLKTEDWQALNTIAAAWAAQEPNTTEALFYKAVAEFSLNNNAYAEAHFQQVVAKNSNNSSALYYLGLIADQNGKRIEALNLVAVLDGLDQTKAGELKVAMGIMPSSEESQIK